MPMSCPGSATIPGHLTWHIALLHQQDSPVCHRLCFPHLHHPASTGCLFLLALNSNAPANASPCQANPAALWIHKRPFPSREKKRGSFMWLKEQDCDNVAGAGLGYFILARRLRKFKQQQTGFAVVSGRGISAALFCKRNPCVPKGRV